MKTICLLLLLVFSTTSNSQDTIARVKYTNLLIYGQKVKILKPLTSKSENNIHVAYGKLGKQDKLWLVNELKLARDGFEQTSYTSYIFLDRELLAIEISLPAKKNKTTYYFLDDKLIYTRGESALQNITELLMAAKTHRTKALLFYKK